VVNGAVTHEPELTSPSTSAPPAVACWTLRPRAGRDAPFTKPTSTERIWDGTRAGTAGSSWPAPSRCRASLRASTWSARPRFGVPK